MKSSKYFNKLVDLLHSFESKEELTSFLKAILTPSELTEIGKRLEIVRQLKAGVPQHQIAKDLRVGVATVTRGSRELKLGNFGNVRAD